MNWSDDGIVLGGRRFGEGGLILDVLTRENWHSADIQDLVQATADLLGAALNPEPSAP